MQEQPSKVDAASRLTSPARPLAFPFVVHLITSQVGGSLGQRSGTTLPFAASMNFCFDCRCLIFPLPSRLCGGSPESGLSWLSIFSAYVLAYFFLTSVRRDSKSRL